ncbi:hypothetical protein ACVGVM_25760 [Pseudonocardia bannensis]|uniref:MucR family transcriptional regulator n=1 Tax=Pseudonocardia bannensis TaxID=630973 RepID=A0A848DN54_9PSEU|nr:hypothetical protein [Pseudonocardia bannensis]NMH94240.1 hypothetical protein [Pseudonocardia bannensis]
MWEPVGPLPASVYWRRRGIALASIISVFVLFGWMISALATPASDDAGETATTRAASRAALTAPVSAGTTTPGTAVGSAPASAPAHASGSTTSGVVATSPGTQLRSPVAGPDATTPAADELVRPDDTPRPPVSVPPSVPLPPTGPVPCTNDMLTVGAEIDRPDHKVGDRPVLRLVVTNVSEQPCVRDLDGARQEIVVWSGDGADRLWSSNDCVNPSTIDLRTLVPGQPVAFAVTWFGRTSTPGCAEPRTPVPAGAYRVMTRVDNLISAPTPFLLLD